MNFLILNLFMFGRLEFIISSDFSVSRFEIVVNPN
jgi:hypothetical protein